jgi:hypothetical protein
MHEKKKKERNCWKRSSLLGPCQENIRTTNWRNYDFYWTDHEDLHKVGTATAVKKGIPHTCVNLPPLVSVEATGVCILIENTEMFCAAVYKSLQRLWSDTDITELLGFKLSPSWQVT